MRRELDEEVSIDTPYTETIVGLINDDETPVGRVHLGMVHLCDVEQPRVRPARPTFSRPASGPSAKFSRGSSEFESWSEIAVRALFS